MNGGTEEIEALVAQKDPLGFDVLMGVNVIKTLGGISITKSEEVHFLCKQALHVQQQHSSLKNWIFMPNLTNVEMDQIPSKFRNNITEYQQRSGGLIKELQQWIEKSWLSFPIVTGKLTKIPKRDFNFARVKTGQVGT